MNIGIPVMVRLMGEVMYFHIIANTLCTCKHTHADIDECGGDHGCQQACNNTGGSFHCACFPGYILNEDGVTCRGTKLNSNIQSS